MSAWGAASTLGGATGVLVGGLLAGSFGWSSVFLVTVPVSVAAVALAPMGPSTRFPAGVRRRLDGRGAATITGAVLALVYGALAAADHGWTSSTVVAASPRRPCSSPPSWSPSAATEDPLVPLGSFDPGRCPRASVSPLRRSRRASTFVLDCPLPATGTRHGPPAGRPRDGPHVAHGIRCLARRTAADSVPWGPHAALSSVSSCWRPVICGWRTHRRPPAIWSQSSLGFARRDGGRAQLHAHHDGHRWRGPGFPCRARVRPCRLGNPGRRCPRHRHVHRYRHRRRGMDAGVIASVGFSAAFTAAAVVALAAAALGCTVARARH